MNVSFLFPGQGSQYPEMLDALLHHSVAKRTIDEASEILDSDVLCLDSATELQSNVSIQITLLVAGVASARTLLEEGISPHAVAGLSVGAYAAAVVCGCIEFHDGLRLVKRRAELMQEAYPTGFGMTVIVGLSELKVQRLVQEVYSADAPIYMSNINTPNQITVSGSVVALESCEAAAIALGARKVERLNVSVPSHCQLYDSAARILKAEFAQIKMQAPRCIYISNVSTTTAQR